MCRINPRVDFAFKKLFGSEENKDLLISLINSIVSEKDQAADIELKNPYNLADYQAGKMSILDIKAKSREGKWYNIEMQINEDLNFEKCVREIIKKPQGRISEFDLAQIKRFKCDTDVQLDDLIKLHDETKVSLGSEKDSFHVEGIVYAKSKVK